MKGEPMLKQIEGTISGNLHERKTAENRDPRSPCQVGEDRPYYEGSFMEMTFKEAIEYAGQLGTDTILEVIIDEH